jgi:uncharacterized surface protein with fasciclin (FAS1) repeats
MKSKNAVSIAAGVAAVIAVAGMASAGDYTKKKDEATKAATSSMTILDTAKAGGFTTLAAAVEAAGLQEALSGKGPLTVFAPTDEAFKKIPKETLDGLLADKEALKSVLLYHVVSGEVMSKDVVKLKSAKTLNGAEVKIDAKDGVRINDSKVTKADVVASNGVIHVIDTVLLPPTE